MNRITRYGAALLWLAIATAATAQDAMCRALDGARVISADGEFLGVLGPSTDKYSIFNSFGDYGNKHGANSIWNANSKNGDSHRSSSAFNAYAQSPPKLMKGELLVGHLTVNKSIAGAVNPVLIGAMCNGFIPRR